MDSLLLKELAITEKNPLCDEERLYYLNKFFHFVEKFLVEENINNLNEKLSHKKMPAEWNDKCALKKIFL